MPKKTVAAIFDKLTFYISSELLSAWCFAQRIRYHRKIENTLHWTKDVILNEDNCGLVNSQHAANMAVIRNICFNLHVMSGYQSISKAISAVGENISTLWHMMTALLWLLDSMNLLSIANLAEYLG